MTPVSVELIRERFEAQFKQATLESAMDPLLAEMTAYHLGWLQDNPGKRLRPLLLLATLQAIGAEFSTGYNAANALELLHNATLVHDDIEDNGQLRHGQTALWLHYGLAPALNFGDHLYALALSMLTKSIIQAEQQLALVKSFQTAFSKVTLGQHLDIKKAGLGVEDYLRMVSLKTGSLFSLAFEAACILSGKRAQADLQAATSAGESLGIAFQVHDDILGIWGEEALTGKSSNSDLEERKLSLPVLLGLRDPQFSTFWEKNPTLNEAAVAKARTLLENCNALAESQTYAEEHAEAASAFLGSLVRFDTPETKALEEILSNLTTRRA